MSQKEDIHSEIQLAIKFYSLAYENFERVQEKYAAYLDEKGYPNQKKENGSFTNNPNFWLPVADQKTGAIGEYFSRLICERNPIVEKAEISRDHNNKAYDLKITFNNGIPPKFIQVKTISSYNKRGKTSPYHHWHDKNETVGNDGLLIILLNPDFISGEFLYVRDKIELEELNGTYVSTKMRLEKYRKKHANTLNDSLTF